MRYLPLTPDDRSAMLAAIGAKSIDDLFVDVPKAAHRDGFVDLPRVAGELEVERSLGAMAAKNASAVSGCLVRARSASSAATLPAPSQIDASGASRYSRGIPDSST